MLLEDVADVSEAIRVAQRLAEALQEPLAVNNHQVSVSTSVGIALGSAHTTDDPEGMLRKADAAIRQMPRCIGPRSKVPVATRCSTRPCKPARRNASS